MIGITNGIQRFLIQSRIGIYLDNALYNEPILDTGLYFPDSDSNINTCHDIGNGHFVTTEKMMSIEVASIVDITPKDKYISYSYIDDLEEIMVDFDYASFYKDIMKIFDYSEMKRRHIVFELNFIIDVVWSSDYYGESDVYNNYVGIVKNTDIEVW